MPLGQKSNASLGGMGHDPVMEKTGTNFIGLVLLGAIVLSATSPTLDAQVKPKESGGMRFEVGFDVEDGKEVSEKEKVATVKSLRKRFRGTKEVKVRRSEEGRIQVDVQSVDREEELLQIEKKITRVGDLKFHMGHPKDKGLANDPEADQPPGSLLLPTRELEEEEGDVPRQKYFLVRAEARIAGGQVKYARAFNFQDRWGIAIKFDKEGADAFFELSKLHNLSDGEGERGVPFAIVLDGVVLSKPVFMEKVTGGSAQITGDYSEAAAKELAAAISSPLPVPLEILHKEALMKKEGDK